MSSKYRKAGALHVFLQLQQAPRRMGRSTRVVSNNRKVEQLDEISDSSMLESQGSERYDDAIGASWKVEVAIKQNWTDLIQKSFSPTQWSIFA